MSDRACREIVVADEAFRRRRRTLLGLFAAGALGGAAARRAGAQAQFPHDVPYVPTAQVTVDEMLRLAGVTERDFVMDLGSGDGRVVITAAQKFGARGMGIELDPHLVITSEEKAREAGVGDRVTFLEQDLFKADLSKATVITMYLLPYVNLKLRPRLLELKPGTRIVAHDFDLGDWPPDRKTGVRKNVFLYIVPARLAGHWQGRIALPPIERLLELEVVQRYQNITVTGRMNKVPVPVWEAKIEGDRMSFVIVDSADRENEASMYFTGRVSGDSIEGEVVRGVGRAGVAGRWRVTRGT